LGRYHVAFIGDNEGHMENLQGNVAVVTGAASGMGRALVDRFAAEGMKIVLADMEADALERCAHSSTTSAVTGRMRSS
jgi:NADP-dependent 3-hydroxy acid dehydrogenase YdfG